MILLIDTVAGTSIVLLRYHRVIRQMYEIIMEVGYIEHDRRLLNIIKDQERLT